MIPPPIAESLAGVRAVLWIALLWYAVPAFGNAPWRAADRARLTVALACGIPFVLAFLNVLTVAALVASLAALVAVRVARAGWRDEPPQVDGAGVAAAAVVLALVWPVAVRPMIDGDTLNYHLPNAASWVAAHGIWTTGTQYWWYPGGSELAGAALWAVAGPTAAGWAGVLPAAVLLLRLRSAGIANGHPPAVGLALGCMVIACASARQQLFSLQNDLWLTALVVEATAMTGAGRAILALIKPHGLVFALFTSRWKDGRLRNVLWLAPIALWFLRDALLWRHATFPPASTAYPNLWSSTIAANLPASATIGWRAIAAAGPCTILGFVCGAAALFSPFRTVALGAAIVVLFAPFAFDNPFPQLATGQSLRIGLPLIGIGALAIVCRAGVVPRIVAALAACAVVVDAGTWWAVFENDASTHDVKVAVAATVPAGAGLVWLSSRVTPRVGFVCPVLFAFVAAWCAHVADDRAAGYLADVYERGVRDGGAFGWLASQRYAAILTWNLPSGTVVLVSPASTLVGDVDPAGSCREIDERSAIVVARDVPEASACGLHLVFNDGRIRVLRAR